MGAGVGMADDSPYLSVNEAAEMRGLSSKRLYALIREGKLVEDVHFTRPRGTRVLFKRAAFLAWMAGKDAALLDEHRRQQERGNRINWNVLKQTA